MNPIWVSIKSAPHDPSFSFQTQYFWHSHPFTKTNKSGLWASELTKIWENIKWVKNKNEPLLLFYAEIKIETWLIWWARVEIIFVFGDLISSKRSVIWIWIWIGEESALCNLQTPKVVSLSSSDSITNKCLSLLLLSYCFFGGQQRGCVFKFK